MRCTFERCGGGGFGWSGGVGRLGIARDVLAGVAVLATSAGVRAQPVPVENPSFEITVPAGALAPGQRTAGAGPGVTVLNADGTPAGFTVDVPGWTSTGPGAGVWRPPAGRFAYIPDGVQVAWAGADELRQAVPVIVRPFMSYRVSAQAALMNPRFPLGYYDGPRLKILSGDRVLAMSEFRSGNELVYHVDCWLLTEAQVEPNQTLTISLGSTANACAFDGVTMTVAPSCPAWIEMRCVGASCGVFLPFTCHPTLPEPLSIEATLTGLPATGPFRWSKSGVPMPGVTGPLLPVDPENPIGVYVVTVPVVCGEARREFVISPGGPFCRADVDDGTGTGTPDGGITIDDLLHYLNLFSSGCPSADIDDGRAFGFVDGGVTIDDLLYYMIRYQDGC